MSKSQQRAATEAAQRAEAEAAAQAKAAADAADAASQAEVQADAAALAASAVELVQMQRDPDMYPAPHMADVHPDEVDNYAAHGWVAIPQGGLSNG